MYVLNRRTPNYHRKIDKTKTGRLQGIVHSPTGLKSSTEMLNLSSDEIPE